MNAIIMTRKFFTTIIIFATVICQSVHAQVEPEDTAVVSSEFETSFYESIKQKGIQNYDKALESLDKCLKLQPDNDVVLFEIGKNNLQLKNYKAAYESFEKATVINPKNRWYFHGMYDVCYETQDYVQSIELVNKLIPFDESYREDLASLYMKTKQFDKALTVINELNATVGKSEKRELYKAQIVNLPQNQDAEVKNLLVQIQSNPQDESNYNALILLYTKMGNDAQAIAIANKLETTFPNSDWAQVTLFKKYLDQKEGKKAVQAMNQALGSLKVDVKIKHRILNEFLIFVKDFPEFDADLENAVGYFKNETAVKVAKEIGKFFQKRQNWTKALIFYEIQIQSNPDDLESHLLILECYVQLKNFELLSSKANALSELFPLEPQPYLYAGMGFNQLKNYSKAKQMLENGIDFIVDNSKLESDFYLQLAEAFSGLGNNKLKDESLLKAKSALKKN